MQDYALNTLKIYTTGSPAGLASGAVYPLGTTTNTFETVDGSGNPAVCTFVVTVEDNEAPDAVCNDLELTLDANGEVVITARDDPRSHKILLPDYD
mgnify:CR=1 FL=1